MGMSMYVEGIKPLDEDFLKMMAVYEACEEARVEIPKTVKDFFNGETPDSLGVVVDLGSEPDSRNHPCCTYFSEEERNGFVIDCTQLPEGVKHIRFYVSY